MKRSHLPVRVGIAAGALGLLGGVAYAASGSRPAPVSVRAASSDDVTDDVRGPCDEAEHARDPRCAGAAPAGATTSTTPDTAFSSTTSSTTPSATTPSSAPATPSSGTRTLDAGGAGTVTFSFSGGTLALRRATPAPSWRVEVEQGSGREIEVDFRSGTRRVQVNVEIEDGQVRPRVRSRDDADGSDVRTGGTTPAGGAGVDGTGGGSASSGPGSGDDSGDDRSGSGGGDDRDSSGPGGGADDDDSSGPGGGD